MNTYIGFDYGTSNVAIGEISGDCVKTYFTKFDPNEDPYKLHDDILGFIDCGVLNDGNSYLKPGYHVFIESAFKGPNARTYQRMTRIGHSIYIIMSEYNNGIHVQYLDNNTWRKILFGKGNTKKEDAQEWAYSEWPFLLDLPKSKRGHCADALMIALAGKKLIEAN